MCHPHLPSGHTCVKCGKVLRPTRQQQYPALYNQDTPTNHSRKDAPFASLRVGGGDYAKGELMTKRELLDFLLPFDDDIRIMRWGDNERPEAMYEAADITYRVAGPDDNRYSNPPLSHGEGFLIIE